jgi:proline dehydrogenase
VSAFDYLVSRGLPFVPRPLVRHFSRPYIAGESLDDAIGLLTALNGGGYLATLDVLGESVHRREVAEGAVREYLGALRAIREHRLDSNISVKLTQLGLKLDAEFCLANVRTLVREAAALGNFVRLDMEDSSCTSATLDIYRRLRDEGCDNLGVVLQACLRRSLADARALPGGASVRLCKGIYVEPRAIAWRDRTIIRRNFSWLLEDMLERGFCVGIATHDEELVWEAMRIIDRRRPPRETYEFQMLLGVDEMLRGIIREAGHRLRVYVPYGAHWYAYSLRRLKENPRLARYVLLDALTRRRA